MGPWVESNPALAMYLPVLAILAAIIGLVHLARLSPPTIDVADATLGLPAIWAPVWTGALAVFAKTIGAWGGRGDLLFLFFGMAGGVASAATFSVVAMLRDGRLPTNPARGALYGAQASFLFGALLYLIAGVLQGNLAGDLRFQAGYWGLALGLGALSGIGSTFLARAIYQRIR